MTFIFLPSLVLPRETFLHPLCCLPRRKASHTIGRNILCHYATSTDDASCTDRDTFEDDAVSTHPDIVLNHYRCRLRALRWKCGEPYNPLDVHRCRLSGHTLLSLHCRQSQRCRDPRSVCYHTHIIANRKLCTWLYVHSTLQIARHRVHRITRGEVKVIPY